MVLELKKNDKMIQIEKKEILRAGKLRAKLAAASETELQRNSVKSVGKKIRSPSQKTGRASDCRACVGDPGIQMPAES
jgi:hypothetical protein